MRFLNEQEKSSVGQASGVGGQAKLWWYHFELKL
jgi:hypothetical protein